jgi:hypothetical protein
MSTETVEVPLSQGLVAIIDAADAEAVLAHKWYAHRDGRTFYAQRKVRRPDGTRANLRLHTSLTGWPLTDHRNSEGLDNRRANLREATKAENNRNTAPQANNKSGYRGVSRKKGTRKWRAYIRVDGNSIHLGYYSTAEDGARAYDAAALELHGEFDSLNFPDHPDAQGVAA